MKFLHYTLVVLSFLFIYVNEGLSAPESFKGYKLVSTVPRTSIQVDNLWNLYKGESFDTQVYSYFDFWAEPILNEKTEILASPGQQEFLKEFFLQNGLQYDISIDDVASLVEYEASENLKALSKRQGSEMNWEAYHRWETISTWLDSLAASSDLVTIRNIGSTTEGRPVRVVKISKAGGIEPKIPFFIDGAFHAREWISPAFVTYCINELATKSELYDDILNRMDFYMIPVLNVDGYEYTHNHTDFRMWRRTRQDFGHENENCKGTDPNRNWEYRWGGNHGSSGNVCSDVYRGPVPFSEPETAAMRDFFIEEKENGVQFQAYLNIHSFAQLILIPWGWNSGFTPDYMDLKIAATETVKAITNYAWRAGHSANILYPTTGTCIDWTYGVAGIKYSYVVELPPISNPPGFILPPDQIIPVVENHWPGIQKLARHIISKNPLP